MKHAGGKRAVRAGRSRVIFDRGDLPAACRGPVCAAALLAALLLACARCGG